MKKPLDPQSQAQLRYRDKIKQIVITFNLENDEERELFEHVSNEPLKKASYIKKLIVDDMNTKK